MSSSSTSPQWKHDVFVCVKPDDRTKDFIKGLFDRLNQVGISYFRYDNRQGIRKENKTERLEAINQWSFAIALVAFSKNYIDFSLCLNELVKILNSKRHDGLVVIPIFYMDRAEVSNSTRGSKYEWRSHLEEAQNILGCKLSHLRAACALAKGYVPVILTPR